jgi:hypothetical protein
LVLLVLAVLAVAVAVALTDGRLGYGTSCNTGERCEEPSDGGVRIVGLQQSPDAAT